MTRKRGLGSGLAALIPSDAQPEPTQLRAVRFIAVEEIRPNRSQPRAHFAEAELDELAESIRRHGVLQPLIVASHDTGGYELIAGERRWRAAQRAGLSDVPVLIQSVTPQELLELALVENVQRADLNPLEEARAYDALRRDFQLSDEEIARRVGKSRVAIVNTRRLLRLAPAAQQALLANDISAGHGRALLRLEQHDDQLALLTTLRERGLSVRELERIGDLAQQVGLTAAARQGMLTGQIGFAAAQAIATLNEQQQAAVTAILREETLPDADITRLCAWIGQGVLPAVARDQLHGRWPAAGVAADGQAVADQRPRERRSDPAPVQDRIALQDRDLMRRFEAQLQTPVQIERRGNAIRLSITVYSDEQLYALFERVAGTDDE
jgi:ParB family transcriptional regulator, chromosome partitioning protein